MFRKITHPPPGERFQVLVMGDPHFKKNNLHIMDTLCKEILDLIHREKPDLFIALGDTLDTHERMHQEPFHAACKFFIEVSKICPVVNLIGNHDRLNNSEYLTDISPFYLMNHVPGITVVDKPLWDPDWNFLFVPYVAPGLYRQVLAEVGYHPPEEPTESPWPSLERPRCIFSHQEFRDGQLGCRKSTVGDVWRADLPLTFNGHLHKYHLLPGVICVGTPIQENYGEDTDKALMMLKFTPDQEHPIIQRIPTTSVPSRITIELWKDGLDNAVERIPPNSMVRIKLHLEPTEIKAIKQDPRYIALASLVEKIECVADVQPTTKVSQIVDKHKKIGDLTLEKVVMDLLADDPDCQQLFTKEILVHVNI